MLYDRFKNNMPRYMCICTVFVGLPVTALVFSLLSGLGTALVMYSIMRRRGTNAALNMDNQVTGPVYDIPQTTTALGQELRISNNVAYGYRK